jgi:hypothetical protein
MSNECKIEWKGSPMPFTLHTMLAHWWKKILAY